MVSRKQVPVPRQPDHFDGEFDDYRENELPFSLSASSPLIPERDLALKPGRARLTGLGVRAVSVLRGSRR